MSKQKDENKTYTTIKGPSLGYTDNLQKRQMWEEIAKAQNGDFKVKHTSGHDLEIHNITIPYKKWNIEISVSDTRPLKFNVSFSSLLDFKLSISREDLIERVIQMFRKSKIELGWSAFDKQYLIKSNRSDFVKKMFTKEIQKTMLKHKLYSLSYQTNTKTNKAELISVIQRQAGDKAMMVELIEMFKQLIDNIEKLRIVK